MACLSNYTLKSILADCNPNLAGIAEVWLGYYGDWAVSADTESSAMTHTISSITAETGARMNKMQHYTFAKQTGSLTSTLTKDEANGTRYYTNELALQFSKMEARKHLEIEAMAAEQLVGIVRDLNGKYWFIGYDGYLSASDATAQSGQSYDDNNGYNITLQAMSAFLPFEMTKTQVDSVIESED